jgi:hypothetical protein
MSVFFLSIILAVMDHLPAFPFKTLYSIIHLNRNAYEKNSMNE